MFTGLIEEIGIIKKKQPSAKEIKWTISASKEFMHDVKIGDSISVAGVCQTVIDYAAQSFSFYSSQMTVDKTNFSTYIVHQAVNLEKALKIGDRLGGHFVYGHVETKGKVLSFKKEGESFILILEIPKDMRGTLISEGSLAVDGVSLTIGTLTENTVQIYVIPHTAENTTLKDLKTGQWVNLESDPLVKIIHHFLHTYKKTPSLQEVLQKNDWFL